ncbi:hypothetical protein DFAR_2050008 [Desulfarculales bacterium]
MLIHQITQARTDYRGHHYGDAQRADTGQQAQVFPHLFTDKSAQATNPKGSKPLINSRPGLPCHP